METNIKTLVAVALFALATTTATARSWRIHNDVTKGAHFTSINAAMSSQDVEAGDTLYLDPGCSLTSEQTVSKQVTIIGTSYFRTDMPHPVARITGKLKITAENTKVEGVIMTGTVYLCNNYITLERCKTETIYINEAWNSAAAQYATIRQCYVTNIMGGLNSYSQTDYRYKVGYATIENCIIRCSNATPVTGLFAPTIRNCYICYTGTSTGTYLMTSMSDGFITNNILINKNTKTNVISGVNGTENQITNNVFSCAEDTYKTVPDNIFLNSNDESLVFALEGTNDQNYRLKEGSPAIGVATDGGDCGPFAGLYPYVINGLPQGYPYYTKAAIGGRAKNDKVNVSLQIQLQDE